MNPRDSAEAMETQPGGGGGGREEELDADGGVGRGGEEAEAEDDRTPGAFDCNVCGRSFPFLSSLSQHMRRHTGARPYKCPYCDHRASQKGNLKVHIRSHKLGTLSSHHSNEDEDEGAAEEEEEGSSAEVGVSEGLDGGTSPTKSSSACNQMINGDGGAEESRRKGPARSLKREKSVTEHRPFCCRLCGYEAQREDQLLSHIEKVHITADAEDEAPVKEEVGSSEAEAIQPQSDGTFPCETCGQVFTQAWFLKSHMKKHAGILEHCCRICGRRFREAWFLKSHMKTHNTKSKSRPKAESTELPATINDVAQDPDAVTGAVNSVYQICSKCGNLFHNRESLRAHEKVHSQGCGKKPQLQHSPSDDEDSPAAKRRLLDYFNLQTAEKKQITDQEEGEEEEEDIRLGYRIPELDPVCSYQAWQLATRGRVVEPMEPSYKASSGAGYMGEEALAGAAVVYEKESSRFVLKGQEKRAPVGRRGSSGLGGGHASSGDRTPESLSDTEYRPSSRQDRRRPSQNHQQTTPSKSNECFECGKVFRSRHQMTVHLRVHRRDEGKGSGGERDRASRGDRWGSTSDPESGSPSRPSTPGYGDSPPASTLGDQASEMGTANSGQMADEKPYVCSLCDFVTSESSAYLSHVRLQHPAAPPDSRPSPLPSPPIPSPSPAPSPTPSSDRGGATPAGYPKLKRALLQGLASQSPSPQPHPSAPQSSKDQSRPSRPSSPPAEPAASTPVDLCVRAGGHRGQAPSALDGRGLPSHKCSFCSHSTRYPEVLWMHQTVAHRINSNSSALAPKWALRSVAKAGKDGSASARRRTGPPPVLEGQECPPLPPLVRAPRTRPPTTASSSASAATEGPKRSRASGHPSASSSASSSTSSSSSRSSTSGSQAVRHHPPHPPHHPRPVGGGSRGVEDRARSRPKVDLYPRGVSSSSSLSSSTGGSLEKSTGGPQRTSSVPAHSSPAGGGRPVDRYTVPQEGLGFMLSSKHGLAEYSRARGSPQPSKTSSTTHHHHQHQPPKTSVVSHQPPHHNTQQHSLIQRANTARPSAIAHSSSIAHGYGVSQTHGGGGGLQSSSSSSLLTSASLGPRGDVKQEAAETPEMPLDVLSFLKNYSPHELAALYHRWGAANALLDPTGMLRSLMRQGQYVCHECGKSFSQPSHLRTHMRSHTAGFDFNGLHRGSDAHGAGSEAPKQGRDHSAASSARTEPLRKGT